MPSIRRVFFGCNYNDKRIKGQFDLLKVRLEQRFPVECVVVDKRAGKAARDLWRDIRTEIDSCGLVFFDVTAFRPNVVLELGYALALKDESNIFITFRKRKSKGKVPGWLMSDISHLNRFEYTTVDQLDSFVEEQLGQADWMRRMREFNRNCEEKTTAPEKYKTEGLKVVQTIRDSGPRTADQIDGLVRGSAVRRETLTQLLRGAKLVKRTPGRPGRFYLPDD
jgi:nucleoside 2-deoxyribosyltransferase